MLEVGTREVGVLTAEPGVVEEATAPLEAEAERDVPV